MKRLIGSVLVTGGFLLVASCGSRTGLFGADAFVGFEAGVDAKDVQSEPDVVEEDVVEEDAQIACIPGTFPFTVATTQLMFVIDRSGSMDANLDGHVDTSNPSRWDTLGGALGQTIVGFDQQIAMGAKFFPLYPPFGIGDIGCELDTANVDFTPALGNAANILDVFAQTAPKGGTPTSDALTTAVTALTSARGVARTIVLATDGEPNCNEALDPQTCECTLQNGQSCVGFPDGLDCLDIDRTVATIADIATKKKIPVYVLGIVPQTDTRLIGLLDQMAVAGGRPRPQVPHSYNVQTPLEMEEALKDIRESVAGCTYLTPSAPTDPNAIDVYIGVPKIDRDPTHTTGWDWVDQTYGELAFFGDACKAAQVPGASVTGVVRCVNQ